MFVLGLAVGLVLGGTLGVILMALFKINKTR